MSEEVILPRSFGIFLNYQDGEGGLDLQVFVYLITENMCCIDWDVSGFRSNTNVRERRRSLAG